MKRPAGFLTPKVEIVIACEGRNTEPRYFRDCIDGYGAGLVKLTVLPVTGVPLTIVRAAIDEREKLLAKRRRSHDSFDAVFRVWAVFDRDIHPSVPEALELARVNYIDVAFSDPCFELWPLLHLEDYGAQDGRHEVQSRLAGKMPSYDHSAGAIIDFEMIKDSFDKAYDRARLHLRERSREGCPLGCPSTTVGELVLKIRQNGKKASRTPHSI